MKILAVEVSVFDMETVYNIKMYACLNYLFEKSHVKYTHAALLLYWSDFIVYKMLKADTETTWVGLYSICIHGGQKV